MKKSIILLLFLAPYFLFGQKLKQPTTAFAVDLTPIGEPFDIKQGKDTVSYIRTAASAIDLATGMVNAGTLQIIFVRVTGDMSSESFENLSTTPIVMYATEAEAGLLRSFQKVSKTKLLNAFVVENWNKDMTYSKWAYQRKQMKTNPEDMGRQTSTDKLDSLQTEYSTLEKQFSQYKALSDTTIHQKDLKIAELQARVLELETGQKKKPANTQESGKIIKPKDPDN